MEYLKEFGVKSFLIILFLFNSCSFEKKNKPKGFISVGNETNIEKSGIKPIPVNFKPFETKLDSLIRSDYSDSRILNIELEHPVTEVIDGEEKGLVYIDSSTIDGYVRITNDVDTSYLNVIIKDGKIVDSRIYK